MRPKRKSIPARVKAIVLERQNHHCAECKTIFMTEDKIEFDHRPPIILRAVNVNGDDYHPPQNDPDYLDALHTQCHLKRTVGRLPGAEKTVTTKGSDAYLKSKFNRLEGKNKLRRKVKIAARKNAWPKRKFGQ